MIHDKNTYLKILYLLAILVILTQLLSFKYELLSSTKIVKSATNCSTLENDDNSSVSAVVKKLTRCENRIQSPSIEHYGSYWVLYNYVVSKIQFRCSESVTFTTNGDFTYLDNIEPVVTRWQGPISMSIHAPGDDYQRAVDSIRYLRQCRPEIIKKFVTFHVYFDTEHMPKEILGPEYLESPYDCNIKPPFMGFNTSQMYKNLNNVTYPVNVGRNIARKGTQTHYFLTADVELYPSPNMIPTFLDMIARNEFPVNKEGPKVFTLSIFEVEADQQVPENKTHLQQLLQSKVAIPFHKNVCSACHALPKSKEWEEAPAGDQVNVFYVGKRTGPHHHWEPFFIGTHSDPYYDDRLSWDGRGGKMPQAYIMCVLDYDFMILDNAFLVHKPGIKYSKPERRRDAFTAYSNRLMRKKIFPELIILYGQRKGCSTYPDKSVPIF